ncbi:acyl-CoA dehydrogenase family protein [Paenibacillus sp. J2TS4]|uniref:acyl-CoA dehydrogenase family protein n=1 Tax=Paenibacillus sp. J2TS4 TaxID=2807194 RepID=UPI001B1F5AA4|nr:acyl-CoA dehydrogenase family protein [Paenibacillus sp. J2TS4]GIP32758.1 acyl-CoA dehydrogenase [Paenibacillus sp. J2TS4]
MNKLANRGGGFLLAPPEANDVFTPEDLTEEQRMIADLAEDFIEGEVVPYEDQIERQDLSLTVKLLKKAGELGLLAADVPEEYGGTDLDKISSTLITEKLVRGGSFALSHGAHVGIGSLPIILFGSEEQKQRYLPALASGEKLAAYCLTEASSGSDALGAKTTAVLSEDGKHYIMNGSKQFITNAGFADVFIVYAKVDGDKFTAFIVERDYPGVSTGPEEHKMGIKGSSTRPLILEDVPVPAENVLGEIGRGHVIAFNILNIGRYKLAAGCLGSAKWAIRLSVDYGKQRKQFNKALVQFPLIRQKLADMAIRTYVMESMVYRTGGLIDASMRRLDKSSPDYSRKAAKAIEEYAIECSINKVFASEALDFAADEGVQIHGGYGYIQEYKIEQLYRDSRINRIFEGTNEINRLLIPAALLRKAMKGELPLMDVTRQLQQELISYLPPMMGTEANEPLARESAMIEAAKKIFLMLGGTAVEKYRFELEQEQEIVECLADVIIEIYAMESAVLRATKTGQYKGGQLAAQQAEMAAVYVEEAFGRIERRAKTAVLAMEDGDLRQVQLSILKKLSRWNPLDVIGIKRRIASRIIDAGGYVT